MIQRAKRRKLLDREASVRLGIMRHVYVILDLSQAMNEQDLKPTRQICTLKVPFPQSSQCKAIIGMHFCTYIYMVLDRCVDKE